MTDTTPDTKRALPLQGAPEVFALLSQGLGLAASADFRARDDHPFADALLSVVVVASLLVLSGRAVALTGRTTLSRVLRYTGLLVAIPATLYAAMCLGFTALGYM